jgi:hypothetical protein
VAWTPSLAAAVRRLGWRRAVKRGVWCAMSGLRVRVCMEVSLVALLVR